MGILEKKVGRIEEGGLEGFTVKGNEDQTKNEWGITDLNLLFFCDVLQFYGVGHVISKKFVEKSIMAIKF